VAPDHSAKIDARWKHALRLRACAVQLKPSSTTQVLVDVEADVDEFEDGELAGAVAGLDDVSAGVLLDDASVFFGSVVEVDPLRASFR
jgi:hypothetical protein